MGTNFDLPAEVWPELCTRVAQILNSEQPLFAVDAVIEKSAQHIYSQIIARSGELQALGNENERTQDFKEVDVNSLQQIKPRSVGAEHGSLEALKDLQIPQILEEASFSGNRQRGKPPMAHCQQIQRPRGES